MPAAPVAASGKYWKIAAGVLALAFTVSLWAFWRAAQSGKAAPQSVVRLDLDLGPDVSFGTTMGSAVVLSPDGARLVFVSENTEGIPHLFTRRLDQPKSTLLPGTEGANTPFFSPDGQWVGFFARGKLKKVAIDGGEPVILCDASAGRGASWSEDGSIIAALDTQAGLSVVNSQGGKAVPLTELDSGENSHRWPRLLPGGKAVVFDVSRAWGNNEEDAIGLVSLTDHKRKIVLEHAGMYPQYMPGGSLAYVTKGTLFAVPFDIDRMEAKGPAALLEEVSSNPTIGYAQVDISRSGTLVCRKGRSEGLRTVQWLDAAGQTSSFGIEPGYWLSLHLSPDGGRLAVNGSQGAATDVWIYDWQRNLNTRVTNGMATDFMAWSHDGRFLFVNAPGGMFWTRADGSGGPQSLTQSKRLQLPNWCTKDGKLIYSEELAGGGAEIRILPVASESSRIRAGKSSLFQQTRGVSTFAALSPDGRWLAYADAEAGRYDVYVRDFPENRWKVQVSNAGGTMPVWSRTSNELFYRTQDDHRIMVASYSVNGETFVPQKPRVWSRKHLANVGLASNIDLAPDGKRFAVLMPAETPEPRESQSHITVVVNLADEVRHRVAVAGK
jgi:serine/threonine-protein kinase